MIHPSLQHPPLEMNLWLRGVLGLFPLTVWGAQRSHRCWPKYRMTGHGEHANALTLQGQNPNSASPEAACAIKLAHTLVQLWTMGFLHIHRALGSQPASCSSQWCYSTQEQGAWCYSITKQEGWAHSSAKHSCLWD